MKRRYGIAALVLGVATASADVTPSPEAQAHIDAGVAAYNAKDYETASRELKAAYELVPLPKVLFGWAQARRLGGHCDEAIPLYRRYLATKPNDEQIEAATTAMLRCERGQAPPPVAVAPRTEVTTRFEPVPWYRDRVGGALALGGVASAAIGTTFLVLASRSEDAAALESVHSDFVARLDEATLRRRVGWAGIGVGSALIIAAIGRYVIHDEHTRIEITAQDRSIALSHRF
ncbi:MAG: hypothetical protein AB7T06_46100 [Kofleriaceae bacterium]